MKQFVWWTDSWTFYVALHTFYHGTTVAVQANRNDLTFPPQSGLDENFLMIEFPGSGCENIFLF